MYAECFVGVRSLEKCVSCIASYSSKQEIDEGLRLGDYPVLPWRSAQEERPTGWWDDQDRRDKETPVSHVGGHDACKLTQPCARCNCVICTWGVKGWLTVINAPSVFHPFVRGFS